MLDGSIDAILFALDLHFLAKGTFSCVYYPIDHWVSCTGLSFAPCELVSTLDHVSISHIVAVGTLHMVWSAYGIWNEELFSLFIQDPQQVWFFLEIYVDDILIIKSDTSNIFCLKQFLQQRFQIKNLGELHYFVGT